MREVHNTESPTAEDLNQIRQVLIEGEAPDRVISEASPTPRATLAIVRDTMEQRHTQGLAGLKAYLQLYRRSIPPQDARRERYLDNMAAGIETLIEQTRAVQLAIDQRLNGRPILVETHAGGTCLDTEGLYQLYSSKPEVPPLNLVNPKKIPSP